MDHSGNFTAESLIPQHATAPHNVYGAQGGFLASQTSPQRPVVAQRSGTDRAIMPVTFKQLLDSDRPGEDVFHLHGMQIQMVTFVALVRSIAPHGSVESDSGTEYLMDDSTGLMPVVVWSTGAEPLRLNAYGRIFGQFRRWKGRLQVQAQFSLPVEDMNELSYHLLEVISFYNFATKGPLPLPPPRDQRQQPAGGQQMHTQQAGHGAAAAHYQHQHQQPAQQQVAGNYDLSPMETDILTYVKQRTSADGEVSRDNVTGNLSGRYAANAVNMKMDELVNKGFLTMGRSNETVVAAF